MNDKLQDIKDAQKRRFELLTDLTNQKEELAKQKKGQQRAIKEGRDPLEYETAMMHIETRIAGIKSVIKTIDEGLKDENEEQAKKQREEKLEAIEQAKRECLNVAAEIYLMLSEVLEKTKQLREKYAVYKPLARGIEIQQDHNFQRKVSNLIYLLEKGIAELLPSFPREIFTDGELPSPDELRRSIRK
jgi:hypothetical protein